MNIEDYFDTLKELQSLVLDYVEDSDSPTSNFDFENLIKFIQEQRIQEERPNFIKFLRLVLNISNNHHRQHNFMQKIFHILQYFEKEIKQNLSNLRIFQFFASNKLIILFLLEKKILFFEQSIIDIIMNITENNGIYYYYYFLPEIKEFITKEKYEDIKQELINNNPNILDNYYDKRRIGENDSYICTLIRQDSVEEFISYINREVISPSSQIKPSIYETNPIFLMKFQPTLIEYASFYGSIEIFQYLKMNNAELRPRLWYYSIHSKNAELIHLLEENNIQPIDESYVKCFEEAIKCHHNDIANYIQEKQDIKYDEPKYFKNIIKSSIKYYNFKYFPKEYDNDIAFFYFSKYKYPNIIEQIMSIIKDKYERKIKISKHKIRINEVSEKDEIKIIYYLLLKQEKIDQYFSQSCLNFEYISIPPSIISIKDFSFSGCSSLKEILIPSTVKSIGQFAFFECLSLKQIIIPSSVTFIGDSAFSGCSSLTKISIHSSVTSISNNAFLVCSSLTQILIPSSVTKIGKRSFFGCSSLTKISIPSSVILIKGYAFSECTSLTQITIPSSVTSIKGFTFSGCSSLTQISIPSSVQTIKKNAFSKCSSLSQITIPSSVTSIGDYVFSGCTSLTHISIPSSVTSIKEFTFFECSSLIQISIPSSVQTIKKYAFSKCSSLSQITIPSSVTSIGDYAFFKCSSLTHVTISSPVIDISPLAFKKCTSLKREENELFNHALNYDFTDLENFIDF